MRARRGNYSVLFTLSFTIMMGFAAFAVDIGQLRLSRVRAESAASSAAFATMDALVSGATDAGAAAAGSSMANANPLPGISEDYSVTINLGTYDWDTNVFSDGGGASAARVSVRHADGMGMLFAPLLLNDDSKLEAAREVGARQTVAARRRDFVVVVDVSRDNTENIDQIGLAIDEFYGTLDDLGIRDEQVSLVAYAGDGVILTDLVDLQSNFSAAQAEALSLSPCALTTEDWANYYRFVTPVAAQFLGFSMGVGPMDLTGFEEVAPTLAWPPVGIEMWWYKEYQVDEIVLDNNTDLYLQEQSYGANLSEPDQQLAAMVGSWLLYAFAWDEGIVPSTSPLNCRDGNWYEGRPEAVVDSLWLPGVDDGVGVLPVDIGPEGTEQYMDGSYARAGSNPAAGLNLARAIVTGPRRNPDSDPVVILITGADAECSPEVNSFATNSCESDWQFDGVLEAVALENEGATVHVISVLDEEDDEDDDVYLSGLPSADGTYFETDDPSDVGAQLDAIARDVKLQVVHDGE
ncbi:MAG: pilus assembly protein TadG-related protein [Myxococcota bacterium]